MSYFYLKSTSLLLKNKNKFTGRASKCAKRRLARGVPPLLLFQPRLITKVMPEAAQTGLVLTLLFFSISTGISASSPLQTSMVRPAGLADFGPSSASSPLSSPLSKGNSVPGTPKSLHLTSSLAPDSLVRKQGKGTNPSGGR